MYEMTFREKVHTILCIEGGMSKKAVEILDSTAGYKQKALYLLRQKGFIELKKGAYRLTKEGLSAEIWRDHVPKQYTSMVVFPLIKGKLRSLLQFKSVGHVKIYIMSFFEHLFVSFKEIYALFELIRITLRHPHNTFSKKNIPLCGRNIYLTIFVFNIDKIERKFYN